jgi:hypothetical protein
MNGSNTTSTANTTSTTSTAGPSAKNATNPITQIFQVINPAEQDIDHVLWFIGRAIEACILIGVITICIVFRHVIYAAAAPKMSQAMKSLQLRKIHRCCVYCFCCSWSPVDLGIASRMGFEELRPSGVLVLTLICATGVAANLTFFIKVWTEPIDGTKKYSRVHRRVQGAVCNLGGEHLQLDWFGDEEVVVVQAICPGASPGIDKEKPLGEVRIPRSEIVKYAGQSKKGDSSDDGTRTFTLLRADSSGDSAKPVDPLA